MTLRSWILLAQLAVAALLVWLYRIESPEFLNVFLLACGGYLANQFLPGSWRPTFFVLLSVVGMFIVLQPADAAWLLGCGLALIALCHLPIPTWGRALVVMACGGLLAASRAGTIAAPWSALVWPILGSMFMFRLLIYMRAIKSEEKLGRVMAALGYFFMLPNLVFPLFPVVDYQTYRRTYYDKDPHDISEQGLMWIARGLVHLVLYRLVYHRFLGEPADVAGLGDLVQFMLATFLLYLKVSGTFHIAVGMLHLFGFRLPETHKLYYLSSSFTELWRRINIYWKDFMMSLVFYPVYFRVKRLKPALAIGIATAAVFGATWLLHSYQWFWLRGGFPVTPQDIIFWGVLGLLVIAGAIRELRRGSGQKKAAGGWSLARGIRTFLTFSAFCFLWSLWSTDSIGLWIWTLGAAASVDAKGVTLLALLFTALVLLGGRNWEALASRGPAWLQFLQRPSVRTSVSLLALLLVAQPALQRTVPANVAETLAALRSPRLNAQDAEERHRGYYEALDVRPQLAAAPEQARGRENWRDLSTTGVLRIRSDFLERDLLPSRSVLWNGLAFSTNQWGMRDREYSRTKPQGTLRIALLGPSHVMGNGVADGQTFEALVEERLNREFALAGFARYEILNFAVDGYCASQQLALLEDRVFEFSPDVVIATAYTANALMTRAFLQKVVSRGIEVPYQPIRDLLADAGLSELSRSGTPIPFESWRSVADGLGIEARMPQAEVDARIRGVSSGVSDWSIQRMAEASRQHGAFPVILALDAVLDVPSPAMPNERAIRDARLPVMDLLNIFPADRRESLRVAPWDEHPNVAGHKLIADNLYRELTGVLAREFAQK